MEKAEKTTLGKILMVDDDTRFVTVMSRELTRVGFEMTTAETGSEVWGAIQHSDYDVVLLDLRLGSENGLEILDRIRGAGISTEVIILTGHGTIETAIEAMRMGAREYLMKPCKIGELEVHLRKAVEERRLRDENASLRRYLSRSDETRPVLTENSRLKEIIDSLPRIAADEAPVLLLGESGTGKELVARRLHDLRSRGAQPFVVVNCSVLGTENLRVELFGQESEEEDLSLQRTGLMEIAAGGTVFLDEIGEIEDPVQADLLRFLQTGSIRRKDGTREIPVPVRLLAATSKNLQRKVEEGLFREDLFFRLNVLHLHLPPLRERPEDVDLLTRYYLDAFGGKDRVEIKTGALKLLRRYSWPGNVRELQNVVRRILILQDCTIVDEDIIRTVLPQAEEKGNLDLMPLAELEQRHILRVLLGQNNDKRSAAKILGISLKTLYNKLHRYGVMEKDRD